MAVETEFHSDVPPNAVTHLALLHHPALFWWMQRPTLIREVGWFFLLRIHFGYFTLHSLSVVFFFFLPVFPLAIHTPAGEKVLEGEPRVPCAHRLEPALQAAEPALWLRQVPCSPCCAPAWCLSLWRGAHSVRLPSCLSDANQSWSQEGGQWYSKSGNGLLLFLPLCVGGECARKWRVKSCNSELSQWAPRAG